MQESVQESLGNLSRPRFVPSLLVDFGEHTGAVGAVDRGPEEGDHGREAVTPFAHDRMQSSSFDSVTSDFPYDVS